MRPPDTPAERAELALATGARLRRVRLGYGEDRASLARLLGLRPRTVAACEDGQALLPLAAALELRRKLGVSLDWLYTGAAPLPADARTPQPSRPRRS